MTWQEIHQLDQQLTLRINSWYSDLTDPMWQFFSNKYVWIPMYVAIVALLIWKLGWKKGLVVVAAAGLTFAFCDQFSGLIKYAVGRIRPLNDEYMISQGLHVLEQGRGYSFFSAHAANAFGLACSTFVGFCACIKKKPLWLKAYGGWMFFWAFMVSASRIFVGKHYLGDVIAGALAGAVAGLVLGYLSGFVTRRIKS